MGGRPMNPKRNPKQAGNRLQQTRRDIANLNYIIRNTYSTDDIMALRKYRDFLTASLVIYLTTTNVTAYQTPRRPNETSDALDQEIKNRSIEIKRFKRDVQLNGASDSDLITKLECTQQEQLWRKDMMLENLQLKAELADYRCFNPDGTIELEDAIAENTSTDDVVLATDENTHLKETHHHYCGFYSKNILPPLTDSVKILGKLYNVTKEMVLDIATSGKDTIMTLKKTINTTDIIPLGTPVYTSAGKICGMITSKLDNMYLLQDGFKNLNLHLTNLKVEFQTKVKPICYAGKQFANKKELIDYLNSTKRPTALMATIYHRDKNEAQLIVHKDGVNIINQHFRHRVRDPQFQQREKIRDILQQKITDPCKLSKLKITTKQQYDLIQQLLQEELYYLNSPLEQKELINRAIDVAYRLNRKD